MNPGIPRRRWKAGLAAASTAGAVAVLAGCGGSSSGGANPPAVHNVTKTYPHVSKKANKHLERTLPTLHGVQSVTYYAAKHSLQVVFKDATDRDEQNVENLIARGS